MTGVFWSALAAGLFWDGGGLVLGMTEVGFCTALREPQGPAFESPLEAALRVPGTEI